ncbi:unnamed protein product [Ambrosiozyma monospora]|uniref:Unnamed protein product n=1 Tax=Ambrosiozyma monospora TaxID=43982 RepID=A0A9W6WLE1_AMBMO|nr:unnamed protein product [Ambrosiozyma monospora]
MTRQFKVVLKFVKLRRNTQFGSIKHYNVNTSSNTSNTCIYCSYKTFNSQTSAFQASFEYVGICFKRNTLGRDSQSQSHQPQFHNLSSPGLVIHTIINE